MEGNGVKEAETSKGSGTNNKTENPHKEPGGVSRKHGDRVEGGPGKGHGV